MVTLLETKFYNDKSKFIEAIKELFQTKSKLEAQEYNLLKAYDRGELSLGQVANILNLSKAETMELLKRYDIPFIRVDSEYLEQEFGAFK
jgi:predicted HTH domain antitoxin